MKRSVYLKCECNKTTLFVVDEPVHVICNICGSENFTIPKGVKFEEMPAAPHLRIIRMKEAKKVCPPVLPPEDKIIEDPEKKGKAIGSDDNKFPIQAEPKKKAKQKPKPKKKAKPKSRRILSRA